MGLADRHDAEVLIIAGGLRKWLVRWSKTLPMQRSMFSMLAGDIQREAPIRHPFPGYEGFGNQPSALELCRSMAGARRWRRHGRVIFPETPVQS